MADLRVFQLAIDSELRVLVEDNEAIVELVDGRGEVFGSELEKHKKYSFPKGSRFAVFTYTGATVEVVGKRERVKAYVSDQTPMPEYLSMCAAVTEAEATKAARGPRIMLVGPTDVGKSTVCRILCNYSVRMGRNPILVDLDVGQGSISVPGTVGAIFIKKEADIVDGFDRSSPLVFSLGSTSPGGNLPLFDLLVMELADKIAQRCSKNTDSHSGGIIINTCGWVDGAGYSCLVSAAKAFDVNTVVILAHERLHNDLQRDLPSVMKNAPQILHMPKSGGIETRSRDFRAAARKNAIHTYFYGSRSSRCYPFSSEVHFSEVIIAKIGTEKLPENCLPFGARQEDHNTKMVTVSPSSELLHTMLAVSGCAVVSQAVVIEPVLGFVVVNKVDEEARTLHLLCPQNTLPSKLLILTEIKFSDDM